MRKSGFDRFLTGKDLIGVEVGVNEGDHALALMKMGNIKLLYLIDPYLVYEDYSKDTLSKNIDALVGAEEVAKKKVINAGLQHKAKWIKKTSMDAVKDFEDNSLDFVYIDGNHTFKYVLEDMEGWLPKVKSEGWIGGHDYRRKQVYKAVNQFCADNNYQITQILEDWLFQK